MVALAFERKDARLCFWLTDCIPPLRKPISEAFLLIFTLLKPGAFCQVFCYPKKKGKLFMVGGLVIAGSASGVGKTTFTTALIAVLRRTGYAVQPFKVGPDYLDPTYHTLAAGRPCRNLDTWLLPPANLVTLFRRSLSLTPDLDFALVEGVMGLYDGKNEQSEEGSTAGLAKLLGLPVVVVLDVGKLSRTAGALSLGLQQFDPELNLRGFLLNNAGGVVHYEWCKQSIEEATGLPVLGWLPKGEDWSLPERHLGLLPATQAGQTLELQTIIGRLAGQISQTVDLTAIENIAKQADFNTFASLADLFPTEPLAPRIRLGIAQDAAFGFYYQDNLDLLWAWGAELVPFSPLADAVLPPELDGLYLGGGFPEVFAEELAANKPMLKAIRQMAGQGCPIYAECGGLMYLCRELTDFEGQNHALVGLVPYRTAMQNRRVTIGYAEARPVPQHPFLKEINSIRAHEFHWSRLVDEVNADQAAYIIPTQQNRAEGWLQGNVLASYLHLHFGTKAALTPAFIEWYSAWKTRRKVGRNLITNEA
jgi:cobyrinic acid a,c-diamide synthase